MRATNCKKKHQYFYLLSFLSFCLCLFHIDTICEHNGWGWSRKHHYHLVLPQIATRFENIPKINCYAGNRASKINSKRRSSVEIWAKPIMDFPSWGLLQLTQYLATQFSYKKIQDFFRIPWGLWQPTQYTATQFFNKISRSIQNFWWGSLAAYTIYGDSIFQKNNDGKILGPLFATYTKYLATHLPNKKIRGNFC